MTRFLRTTIAGALLVGLIAPPAFADVKQVRLGVKGAT
jgi:hypothetical protein